MNKFFNVARLLVVDDDPALLRALRVGLRANGHEVLTAGTGREGLSALADAVPDVVVLDLGLPDLDGLEVCRRIRTWTSVPIIVLSVAGSEERKVAALDGGADDYVTKPFGMDELQARVRVALRRRRSGCGEGAPELEVGDLRLDRSDRTASLAGAPLDLTPTEWQLLAELAAGAGRTCTRDQLLAAVWGEERGDASHLHAYVHRLRQKLGGGSGVAIRTVPGIGYSLGSGTSE